MIGTPMGKSIVIKKCAIKKYFFVFFVLWLFLDIFGTIYSLMSFACLHLTNMKNDICIPVSIKKIIILQRTNNNLRLIKLCNKLIQYFPPKKCTKTML